MEANPERLAEMLLQLSGTGGGKPVWPGWAAICNAWGLLDARPDWSVVHAIVRARNDGYITGVNRVNRADYMVRLGAAQEVLIGRDEDDILATSSPAKLQNAAERIRREPLVVARELLAHLALERLRGANG